MKKVICIMGPTGSGKTHVSIELAKAIHGEIINGDSVQVYKELNIGSAKITADEMQGISHHLLSNVELGADYTVYHFQKDARQYLDSIPYPIVVGGSGLYIKAALYDYQFDEFNRALDELSMSEKIAYIKTHDAALELDWENPRRIDAAYRNISSGFIRSDKNGRHEPLYDIFLIYLDLDRNTLKERLIKRLDHMIQKGFIEETKANMNFPLNIIGYRELKNYLQGMYSLEVAKSEIIKSSMRFAKKQKTWFLNQMKPHVYQALDHDVTEQIIRDVKAFLKG